MAKCKFIVMTKPAEGREDEYNEWYDKVHMADVDAVEGLSNGKRYVAAEGQPGEATWAYLAVHDIETDDLAATMNGLHDLTGTEKMATTDTIDVTSFYSVIYRDWPN